MKIQRKNKTFVSTQILLDLFVVFVSYYISIFLFNALHEGALQVTDFLILMPLVLIITFVTFQSLGVFSYGENTYVQTIVSIGLSGVLINGVAVIFSFGANLTDLPAKLFVYSWITGMILFSIYKLIAHKLYPRILGKKRIVVFGNRVAIDALKLNARRNFFSHYDLIATGETISNIEKSALEQAEGFLILSDSPQEEKLRIVAYAMEHRIGVDLVPNTLEVLLSRSQLVKVAGVPAFHVRNCRLDPIEHFIKRVADLFGAMVLLVLVSPLMLITAIGIKIDDRGPVFFRQERMTQGGQTFNMLKFRTMVDGAEDQTGPVWSSEEDERVTRIGRTLRRRRIDEIPQLINVMKGEMSLVGPRPEREYFVREFEQNLPDFKYRLVVKAGITGLAQVLGNYDTRPEDKLKYDLMYIMNYSLFLDFKILLKTLRVAFSPSGVKQKNSEALYETE